MATGNRASHVGPLGLLFGIEVLGGGQVSEVQVAQLDVTVLPLQTTNVTGGLQDRELEGPGREPASAFERAQLAEQRRHRLVRGLVDDDVDDAR